MVQIAKPNPFMLRDVLLTIGDDDFRKQVSAVVFTPSTGQTSWQGLSPDATVTESNPETWTCAVTMAQDWQNVDSLCNYLHENSGDSVPCVFEPIAGGVGFTATLSLAPPAIGGAVGTQPEATVTMGSSKPARVL